MKYAGLMLAATGLVAAVTVADASSVSEPGQTIGIAVATPLPDGVYFIDTFNYGRRSTRPAETDLGLNIPVLVWATPARILDGHFGLVVAMPNVWVSSPGSRTQGGLTDFFISGIVAWDLGGGVGASYLLAAYLPSGTNLDAETTTINQRFAVGYTADGYNLTANLSYGTIVGPTTKNGAIYPDFLNLDLTATKRFGKWELGPVAFGSTDLPTRFPTYRSQGQIAVGGLVGYDFGPFTVQAYLTRDVIERNYGGRDTRGWLRIVAPLNFGDPNPSTPPASLRARY
ncbi:transporter [Methylorubrum populi]|uniref:transporter n=1 Tax=Methylorubrum populi TaxID=223967 RepID=UPI000DB76F2C|nr:transporter [Methylorubrum populi]PZP66031.1 MAG: transporter [Methylorubrum populi]